jgi:hypothetical protein
MWGHNMKKNRLLCIVQLMLLITTWVLSGCSTNHSVVQPTEYVTYQDDKNHFTIDYPKHWSVDYTDKSVTVMFVSPKENEQDNRTENLTVTVTPLPYEASAPVEKYTDGIVATIKQRSPEMEVVSSRSITIHDYPAIEVVVRGKMSGIEYTISTNYLFKGKTGYVIGYTYPNSDKDKYEEIYTKMLHSFTITN